MIGRILSLKATNSIASGETRRICPPRKFSGLPEREQQPEAGFVPFRDGNLVVDLFVGFHPTLFNSSLSGTSGQAGGFW